jgi:uncharacterized phage protein gp47/JayE
MTLQYRTLDQVLADLQNFFSTNSPNTLVQEGTVPDDIINSFGNESNDFYAIQAFAQYSETLAGLQILISNSPDAVALLAALQPAMGMTATQVQGLLNLAVVKFATNYGVTPLGATFATTTLRFFSTSNANVNIPINTVVTTAGLSAIQYQTTIAIVNMPVTGPDPITGLYYIDVSAQAVTAGTASAVPQNRLTVMSPIVAGLSQVTNTVPSSGGTDPESNASILSRCALALRGRELDTIPGLTLFAKSQIGVLDASTIPNSSPYMTRGVGNQVDIRILGSNLQTYTDTFVYSAILIAQVGGIVLSHQPVANVLSVTVNSVLKTAGVDYNFVKDTGGFSGSVLGVDKVVFLNPLNPGDTVVIQYNYDSLMTTIQSALNLAANQIPNSDILIREAQELLIDITMHVVVFAGYDPTQVEATITSAVEAYFNALLLGAPPKGLVPQSDIASVSANVAGVSYVDISNLSIDPAIGLSDIPVTPIQYPRLNTLTFV